MWNRLKNYKQNLITIFIFVAAIFCTNMPALAAQNVDIKPSVIGYGHYMKLNLKPLPQRTYRILVGKDYPPFNYRDQAGKLVGFNIDIARAICLELNLSCQIIAKKWKAIKVDILNDEADFAVASLTISKQNLLQFEMTRKYYDTPARFIIRKNSVFNATDLKTLRHRNIGVVSGSGHEAYILEYFPEANILDYSDLNKALEKLIDGKVMTVFTDAISTQNWLKGSNSQDCCQFAQGDFYEARFFGQGAAIALPKGSLLLRDWLNKGLVNLWASGRYEEIFNAYFSNQIK